MDTLLFCLELESVSDEDLAKDELIKLQGNEVIKKYPTIQKVLQIFGFRSHSFLLVKKDMAAIILFATSYVCESEFLSLVAIKTKSRNK